MDDYSNRGSITRLVNRLKGIFATKDSVNNDLGLKVDKIGGFGLSSNDYNAAAVVKLAGIEDGAQVNVIEMITINGNPALITDKGIVLSIPYDTSALTNGAKYQTEAQVANAISTAIAGVTHWEFVVITALPDMGEAGKIYLVGAQNPYDEYIWIDNAWIQKGTSNIDLSNYWNLDSLDIMTQADIDEITV